MSVCSLSPTHFPYDLSGAACFHANVSTIRRVHSQVRTLKRRVSTHFWLTRTCLSTAWHLLSHYFTGANELWGECTL